MLECVVNSYGVESIRYGTESGRSRRRMLCDNDLHIILA